MDAHKRRKRGDQVGREKETRKKKALSALSVNLLSLDSLHPTRSGFRERGIEAPAGMHGSRRTNMAR